MSSFGVEPDELMRAGLALTAFAGAEPAEEIPGNFIEPELIDALTGIATRTSELLREGNALVEALGLGLHSAATHYKVVDGWPE